MNRQSSVRTGATASKTLILALSTVGMLTIGIAYAHSHSPSSPKKATGLTPKAKLKKEIALGSVPTLDFPTASKKAKSKKQAKIGTLYVIGYSHLDTEWCWSYPQVIGEFIQNTLDQNFALFQKYPDYVFNWTGSNRYRFMQEYYPHRFAELKKYVAEGKWFPAGSCIEEGDVNSPSEEGLVRQVLYANEYFRKEFGMASTEFMLPDCFGFPASLPSILAHCGLKGFSTQKLTWGSAVGIPFNVGEWVGPDNQMITAALNPGSYTSTIDDDLSKDPYWVNRLKKDVARSGVGVDYHYYGTGDRGGAPDEQSVINMEKSLHGDGPIRVLAGPADAMFNKLTASQKRALPHYKGDLELTWHSCGSLTSEGAMKRWNRKNEYLGDYAEKSSLAAAWLGAQPYPYNRITDAWLRFLPGQFHDLMAGTAIPRAYNFAWNDQILAMNEFADVIDHSVGAVSRGLDTNVPTSDSASVVVYNPLSIQRQDIVDADVTFPKNAPRYVRVVGPNGEAVPSQVDGRSGNTLHVVFLATVPSLGFAHFSVNPAKTAYPKNTGLKVTDTELSSPRYLVKINKAGDVSSIYDKKVQRELLAAPARLAYQYENPSAWPAWNMDWEDQSKPPRGYVHGPVQAKIVEDGPARVSLEITRHTLGSIFHQTLRLAAGSAGSQVVFDTKIDWQGKHTALKATFPLTASNPNVTYNLGPGTIQRDTNNPKRYEDLSHGWFDLTDTSGKWGTTILDDCKYGSDKPNNNTVRLTLIYTPGTRAGYQHQGCQDWGRNIMTYSVEGHDGSWRNGDAQWQAARLNQPLLGFQTPTHGGRLGQSFSFASVNSKQVSIEAMKKSEKGNHIVVRFNELLGENAKNVVLKFAAPIKSVEEVNGQEFKISPTGPMALRNGKLVFSMTPYRPRAFEVTLASDSHPATAPTSTHVALPYNVSVESSWSHKTDARFDSQGDSIPGEMMPSHIKSGGISFMMAGHKAGELNAVACEGQTLHIPAGKNRKLYFLAASSEGDIAGAPFRVGSQTDSIPIQNWDGFIGQWDNRLWGGHVPKLTYDWHNPLIGLVPGFIKRDPVAWYCDHHRKADGTFDIYKFCYLFRYSLAVPNGVNKVTLPNLPQVKIMAASVSDDPNDTAKPIQPLYDVLKRKNEYGPMISPQSGSFDHEIKVRLFHTLYWTPSEQLHYTLDGTTPSASSPIYTKPFDLDGPATVKVAEVDSSGLASSVTTAHFSVNDTVAPTVTSCLSMKGVPEVDVTFSKPLDVKAASNPSNYSIAGVGSPSQVILSSDAESAKLVFDSALSDSNSSITFSNLTDQSPNANKLTSDQAQISQIQPVVSLLSKRTFDGTASTTYRKDEPNLPTGAAQPWTINMWVKVNQTPDDLTPIAGFGTCQDDGGHQRYLCAFTGNLHFWGSNIDVTTNQGFTVGSWQMVSITYTGKTIRIYSNGQLVGSEAAGLDVAKPVVKMDPSNPWGNGHMFKGEIKGFTVYDSALPQSFISALYQK